LAGEITVVEGDAETVLHSGDATTFRAGDPVASYLDNCSQASARCLVMGTRPPVIGITYPAHHRICHCDRSQPDHVWTNGEGNSYH
jgi:uncharacterized cupin superfamily protein